MSSPPDTYTTLRDLEALLRSAPQGELDPLLVEAKVREVLCLLAYDEPHWIDIRDAKELSGIELSSSIEYWVKHGWLHSRVLPDGRLQVLLDDVLRHRVEREGLMAIGGDEMSDEELRILTEGRPGKNPWDRERVKPS
ncbi:MAG: hypothetical protein ACR2PL_19510 [Dehalococcoidia bacterium]